MFLELVTMSPCTHAPCQPGCWILTTLRERPLGVPISLWTTHTGALPRCTAYLCVTSPQRLPGAEELGPLAPIPTASRVGLILTSRRKTGSSFRSVGEEIIIRFLSIPTNITIPAHTLPYFGVVSITCQTAEERPNPLAPLTLIQLVGPHQPTLEVLHQIATDPVYLLPHSCQRTSFPRLLTDPEASLDLMPCTPNQEVQSWDSPSGALARHRMLTTLTSPAPSGQQALEGAAREFERRNLSEVPSLAETLLTQAATSASPARPPSPSLTPANASCGETDLKLQLADLMLNLNDPEGASDYLLDARATLGPYHPRVINLERRIEVACDLQMKLLERLADSKMNSSKDRSRATEHPQVLPKGGPLLLLEPAQTLRRRLYQNPT